MKKQKKADLTRTETLHPAAEEAQGETWERISVHLFQAKKK